MFADHQPALGRLAQSVDGFERIATFALLTIRQPLRIACADYKLVRNGDTGPLFGHKYGALAYIKANAADIHAELERSYELGASADVMLLEVMRIPGIGLAKAGFILQMAYGVSGCIDTHNLTRFNIPMRQFSTGNKAVDRRRVRAYNAMINSLGGTASLWDSWCQYLADHDPANYATAQRVSELHLAPLEY